jgi:hypothetical protein
MAENLKKTVLYQLVLSTTEDGKIPLSYCPMRFSTEKEAVDYWEKEYKHRKVNDGHDEYWNKKPLRIIKITTENLW